MPLFLSQPCHPMPATRARSIAPRFDSYKPTATKASSPRGARHHTFSSDSLSSSSDDCGVTMPLTVKRKDEKQQKKRPQKPAIDQSDVIEISDDDEPSRHLDSQTSMIADFRRQINKLREVIGISVLLKKLNAIFDASDVLFVFRKVSSTRKITSELFESSTSFVKRIKNCKPFENPALKW